MQIRTYQVWGWARSLIYIGGTLLNVVVVGWFIHYPTPEYTTLAKLPSISIPAAWVIAGYMLYSYREAWLGKLAWTTSGGVSVWGEADVRMWLVVAGPRKAQVENMLSEVVAWWTTYWVRVGRPDPAAVLADWFNGTNIEVVATADGVGDPRHGIRAKAGLAYPKRIVLALRPSDKLTGTAFLATLAHEATHECCLAMGVADDNDTQHAFMKQAGCPYA
jgi:hypothetical protein